MSASPHHRSRRTRSPAPPPRALVVAAAVVVAAGVAIAFLGAWRTGVSFDEPYHVMRMRSYLHSGWFMLDGDLAGGTPAPWTDTQYVYGPVAMILLHGWSILFGVDHPGQVSDTATAFAVRHLGVAAISLVGLLGTAALTRVLTRSWGWGVVSAAVLVAVPTWTGHAMFNVKDIPVAVGYTLATLGLVVLAQAGRRRWLLAGTLTAVAGVVLAVGTRPGISAGIGVAGVVVLVVVALRRERVKVAALVVVAVVSLGSLAAVYPAAFSPNPLRAMIGGTTESEHFGGVVGEWDYVPHWLVIQIPTLLLVLAVAGVVVGLLRVRWHPGPPGRRGTTGPFSTETLTLTLVVLQGALLPGVAMARHSNLYNGLRQLIFLTPALAVLATLGLAVLWTRRGAVVRRWRRGLAVAVTALAVLVPMAAQVQLFPFSYAYSSVAAQLDVVDRHVEYVPGTNTDYWRTSVRELAPDVPVAGYAMCTPNVDDQGRFLPRADAMHQDCAEDPVGPLHPYDADRAAPAVTDPTHFVAVATGSSYVGSNCTSLGTVTRPLYWTTVTMSVVADCDLVLPDYPATGMVFAGDGTGRGFVMGDWETRYDEPGMGLQAGRGAIGFTLPPDATDPTDPTGALHVVGTGLDLTGLAASVNGTSVPVRLAGTGSFSLDVPAAVADAYGGGRVVIGLTGPTDVRMLGLRVSRLDTAKGASR